MSSLEKMNRTELTRLIKAMEFVARQINDEGVFERWLMLGIADGDIRYGDLIVDSESEEELEYYTEDDNFAEMMSEFLRVMVGAYRSGGLYCNGVCSEDMNDEEDEE